LCERSSNLGFAAILYVFWVVHRLGPGMRETRQEFLQKKWLGDIQNKMAAGIPAFRRQKS
jgi:hypothetical protein